jgi:hypothetical protein
MQIARLHLPSAASRPARHARRAVADEWRAELILQFVVPQADLPLADILHSALKSFLSQRQANGNGQA